MALVINDRVKETSSTTGTGALTFAGATSGFETFAAGIGNSNTTYYAVVNTDTPTEWEVGLGTLAGDSSTITRTTVISSSNSDSAVNFGAGTKEIFCTLPASKAVIEDASSNVTLPNDLILGSDSSILKFGADSDTTFTHTDGTGLTLNSTNKICFNDTSQFIQGSSNAILALGATDEIDLTATAVDLNGTLDVSGTLTQGGASQFNSTITVGVDDTGYDVKFFGDTASAYMLWDTSADDLVLAGAAGIDLAGDIDVDGTANLDAVDIDGAVQIDNTVTVGVDDTGYDVKFFGATASAYMLWDESADDLILAGAGGLSVAGVSSFTGNVGIDGGTFIFNETSADLDFRCESNGNTHAIFIDGGNDRVGIMTSGPSYPLEVTGDTKVASGSVGVNVNPNATDGRMDASNDVVAFSSDKRLKENIKSIESALDKISSLNGITYNWNDKAVEVAKFSKDISHAGVFAQDVKNVLPEAVKLAPFDNDGHDVSISGDNYLTVQYEKLVPLLINAIKELKEEINKLKSGG